jgi:hypothetical protein
MKKEAHELDCFQHRSVPQHGLKVFEQTLCLIINPPPPESIVSITREDSPPEKEIGHGHNGLPKCLMKAMVPGRSRPLHELFRAENVDLKLCV